jgi:hypothetical protein
MPMPITNDIVDAHLDDGWKRLTPYLNAHAKMTLVCPNGHTVQINWNHYKNGKRCAVCYLQGKRFTNADIDRMIPDGWVRLSDYSTSNENMTVQCPNGHIIEKKWSSLQTGYGCPICSDNKYSNEEVNAIFTSAGWRIIGDYVNVNTPVLAECPNGHYVEKTLSMLLQGTGCRVCAGIDTLTNEEIDRLLDEGWRRIGDYENANKPFALQCPRGHVVNMFWGSYQQGHRCKECRYKNISGKNSPTWNANLSDEDRYHSRLYPEYKEWRQIVLKRDDYTCQACHIRGGKLECHHLNSYRGNRAIGTDPDNGAVLCQACHREFHILYTKRNNTAQQFYEFLGIVNERNTTT